MERVMLTCATRPFGMRVAKFLSEKFEVIKASSDEIPEVIKDQYLKIPKGANPVFAHELLKACLDTNSTYVLPLDIAEIKTISESILLFEEYGIAVLSPNIHVLEELEIIQNPPKDIPLNLLHNGVDILAHSEYVLTADWSGLGLLSDSKDGFILAISK